MGGLLLEQLEIVGVNVHLDTLVTLARQQFPAKLARTANRAKMEVWQLGVERWHIVGVTVHRDILVPIARQQICARLARTANRANTKVWHRGVVRWKIAVAVVRQGTRETTVKRCSSAPLMQMEMLV